MSLFAISVLFGIIPLIALSDGQCIRIRSGNNGQQQSCTCTTVEDLTTLLTIIRALEEREPPRAVLNAEELILQLVNALVYATTGGGSIIGTGSGGSGIGGIGTGGTGTTGGYGNNGGTGTTGGYGNNGGTGTTTGTGITGGTGTTGGSGGQGLIDLGLLQPGNNENNLLKLAIAGKNVLDLGIGHDHDGYDDGLVPSLVNGVL